MIVEKNGWFCTDPDCMQHCRKVTETAFELIQAVWLDTCGDDPKAKNRINDADNFAVCVGFVDLVLCDEKDIEGIISSYGYSIKSAHDIYGESANQIIAECLFENGCLHNGNSIAGVVSWDDAEKVIQKYIDCYR